MKQQATRPQVLERPTEAAADPGSAFALGISDDADEATVAPSGATSATGITTTDPSTGGTTTASPEQRRGHRFDLGDRTWQWQANCMGVDPDLFFPERGASTREAKAVCRGCVVQADCLEYALVNGEKFGIWGGLSERERRRLRRDRNLSRRGIDP